MRVLVDADACPVKGIIVAEAKKRGLSVTMVCDTCHKIADGYSSVVTVDKGADSADLALANLLLPGDAVVTQDYGVAALALGKGAKAINPSGLVYDAKNMDTLLFERHMGQKARRQNVRTKGPKKRSAKDDEAFLQNFIKLLDN